MDYRISGYKLSRGDAIEFEVRKFGKIERIDGKDWLCCTTSAVGYDDSIEPGDRYEIN